jgi:hypothetical protein
VSQVRIFRTWGSANYDGTKSLEKSSGARNEEQLRQNLAAVGWNLNAEQMVALDKASEMASPYPYWHQRQFSERNPLPV